jgi:hypothetical protein
VRGEADENGEEAGRDESARERVAPPAPTAKPTLETKQTQ